MSKYTSIRVVAFKPVHSSSKAPIPALASDSWSGLKLKSARRNEVSSVSSASLLTLTKNSRADSILAVSIAFIEKIFPLCEAAVWYFRAEFYTFRRLPLEQGAPLYIGIAPHLELLLQQSLLLLFCHASCCSRCVTWTRGCLCSSELKHLTAIPASFQLCAI